MLLDWNAAIVLNRDPAPVLAVLELVNVQLLEMRLLDRRLDHSLERSYELLVRRNAWRSVRQPHSLREAMLHTGMLQVDATLLYERVGNAQKIVGDEYLARLYRRAAVRFGLATWHETIEKKLRTGGEIYERAHDRVVLLPVRELHRSERLETHDVVPRALGLAPHAQPQFRGHARRTRDEVRPDAQAVRAVLEVRAPPSREPARVERRAEPVARAVALEDAQHVRRRLVVLAQDPIPILAHHREAVHDDRLTGAEERPEAALVELARERQVRVVLHDAQYRERTPGRGPPQDGAPKATRRPTALDPCVRSSRLVERPRPVVVQES